MASKPDFAIVTPSFLPDLERCALLVESLDRCCPEAEHFLIIDRRDVPAFRHLASKRTHILESEQLIEPWFRRLPLRRSYWLSLSTPPMRGWIAQQILKIAAPKLISQSNLVYCDSDVTFIRPFGIDDLMIDGRIGLLDVSFANDSIRTWTAIARKLLGLPADQGEVRGHVGNMICWRREVVLGLQDHVARVAGTSWQRAIARLPTFSEYILYGVYVREVLGYQAAGQEPSDADLVRSSWTHDITSPALLEAFFSELGPQNVAVMAHSKDPLDREHFRRLIETRWRMAGVG